MGPDDPRQITACTHARLLSEILFLELEGIELQRVGVLADGSQHVVWDAALDGRPDFKRNLDLRTQEAREVLDNLVRDLAGS